MYMKPTKNFRLRKQTKRLMATIVDAHERGSFKRDMIQAQLASEVIVKSEKRRDGIGGPTRGAVAPD